MSASYDAAEGAMIELGDCVARLEQELDELKAAAVGLRKRFDAMSGDDDVCDLIAHECRVLVARVEL
jgi:hypothetical protein